MRAGVVMEARNGARLQVMPPPDFRDKARRLRWLLVEATLFRLSPVPLYSWRRALLRWFGASVAPGARPYPSARIWAPWNLTMEANSCLGPGVICYSVSRITLGAGSIVSQGAHLCAATHDFRDANFTLLGGAIEIGAGAWIAADAFVGPGVRIGRGAVIGARAVAMRNVPSAAILVGNPARQIGERELPGELEALEVMRLP